MQLLKLDIYKYQIFERLRYCEKRNRCKCRFGRRQVTTTGLKCKFGRTINARFAEEIILRLSEDRAIPNFEILQFFCRNNVTGSFCLFFLYKSDMNFWFDRLRIYTLEFVNLERQSFLNNNEIFQETTVNLVMWLWTLSFSFYHKNWEIVRNSFLDYFYKRHVCTSWKEINHFAETLARDF